MTAGDVNAAVMRVARAVARELTRGGARAVVLTGSHARGDAHAESDVDLITVWPSALRRALRVPIRRRSSFLITIAHETEASVRASFCDPRLVGSNVPGWRAAIVLSDADDVASRLQRGANRWRWEDIAGDADAWAAEQMTGYAEEVHKLVAALGQRDMLMAGVQRSILALHLAKVMSVRRRILYGSENVLWAMVAERLGEPWANMQSRALGEHGEPIEDTCEAALALYRLAAVEAAHLFDRRQRSVVDYACRLSEELR